jgi:hypothetical protein
MAAIHLPHSSRWELRGGKDRVERVGKESARFYPYYSAAEGGNSYLNSTLHTPHSTLFKHSTLHT